jgi:hypothetical protein
MECDGDGDGDGGCYRAPIISLRCHTNIYITSNYYLHT